MSWLNNKNPRTEIENLFAQSKNPMNQAITWAKSIAQAEGLDPVKNQIQLIRELRRAEPSLDLKAATYLATETAKAS
ncbi:MAG: hypothetical protein Q4E03_03200 [Trueperella sp.]|nr:hypothetical protein [Trueperella sp.]